jgi:hypothetical protein
MTPQEVKDLVVDMNIWDNAVWVNRSEKLFFVPIWRNGNTTFMNDIAEQFNFTLEKNIDLSDYTGFTILRNPHNRLAGQLWRACVNNNYEINYVVDALINEQRPVDIHLYTQRSFLETYNITYYLDLDNLKYTDHSLINKIIDVYLTPPDIVHNKKSDEFNASLELYFKKNDKLKQLEKYYSEDFELYSNKIIRKD